MGIKLYNLETGTFTEEKVCAESLMNFIYGNPLGKLTLPLLFKRTWFSKIGGVWANSKFSKKSAIEFVKNNGLDFTEFALELDAFETFNDFFTRELREEVRPIAELGNERAVLFPADARHLLIENIGEEKSFYVKGQKFNLESFLSDSKLASIFKGGTMLISRLSPLDYHRFHYPVSGEIVARKGIKGELASVSPIALGRKLAIMWENKRILNLIESSEFGLCAFVEIGATNVGTIVNFGELGSFAKRGSQAGYFKFGGSCVVTIFQKSANIKFNSKLEEMSEQCIETYAHVNTVAGIA